MPAPHYSGVPESRAGPRHSRTTYSTLHDTDTLRNTIFYRDYCSMRNHGEEVTSQCVPFPQFSKTKRKDPQNNDPEA